MELNKDMKNLQNQRVNYEKKKGSHQLLSDVMTVLKWALGALAVTGLFGLSFAGYPLVYLLGTATIGSIGVYGLTKLSNHENNMVVNYDRNISQVHSEMGQLEAQKGAVKRGPKVQLTLPASIKMSGSSEIEVTPQYNFDNLNVGVPAMENGLDNSEYVQGSHR